MRRSGFWSAVYIVRDSQHLNFVMSLNLGDEARWLRFPHSGPQSSCCPDEEGGGRPRRTDIAASCGDWKLHQCTFPRNS